MFTSGEDESVTVSKNTGNIDEAFKIGEGSTAIRIPETDDENKKCDRQVNRKGLNIIH